MINSNERDDQTYFIRRAREERERSAASCDNAAAKAHLKMADEYERRASGDAPLPLGRMAAS